MLLERCKRGCLYFRIAEFIICLACLVALIIVCCLYEIFIVFLVFLFIICGLTILIVGMDLYVTYFLKKKLFECHGLWILVAVIGTLLFALACGMALTGAILFGINAAFAILIALLYVELVVFLMDLIYNFRGLTSVSRKIYPDLKKSLDSFCPSECAGELYELPSKFTVGKNEKNIQVPSMVCLKKSSKEFISYSEGCGKVLKKKSVDSICICSKNKKQEILTQKKYEPPKHKSNQICPSTTSSEVQTNICECDQQSISLKPASLETFQISRVRLCSQISSQTSSKIQYQTEMPSSSCILIDDVCTLRDAVSDKPSLSSGESRNMPQKICAARNRLMKNFQLEQEIPTKRSDESKSKNKQASCGCNLREEIKMLESDDHLCEEIKMLEPDDHLREEKKMLEPDDQDQNLVKQVKFEKKRNVPMKVVLIIIQRKLIKQLKYQIPQNYSHKSTKMIFVVKNVLATKTLQHK